MSSIGHHHHHHHHHVQHNHGHSGMTQENKDYYDQNPGIYQVWPLAKERSERSAQAIIDKLSPSKESTTALDFACGDGNVALELLPSLKSILGVDLSENAVKKFNERFEKAGTLDTCSAVSLDIQADRSALGGKTFDIVYCASAYHHFENPVEVTKVLGSLLSENGALVVIDNWANSKVSEEGKKEAEEFQSAGMISRFGWTEEDMKELYEAAGLTLKVFEVIPPSENGDNDIFIATATKRSIDAVL
ncbi:S-adenosyl-L-methionine-dependent methyltransferase [Coprinopsis sp. MPI-PUGE-AT-0042]|nr:S-adenosyl-L-methionine-dependent methyltransferase [Coprinopsis sp. MPI-PUGE-AT-0042]